MRKIFILLLPKSLIFPEGCKCVEFPQDHCNKFPKTLGEYKVFTLMEQSQICSGFFNTSTQFNFCLIKFYFKSTVFCIKFEAKVIYVLMNRKKQCCTHLSVLLIGPHWPSSNKADNLCLKCHSILSRQSRQNLSILVCEESIQNSW